MEQLLQQMMGSAPGAVVAIVVVIIFIRYLATKDVAHKELVADFRETSKHCSEIIERNSEKLGEVGSVNREMLEYLKKYNGKS